MTIELIYDSDCPNVAQARANLAAALAAVGREPRWTERDRGAADSPAYVRRYGSPTVLVDGRDVSGEPAGEASSCCRVYRNDANHFDGAPPVELITAAIETSAAVAMKEMAPTSGWKSSLATLPAVAAALLPAGLCPACWPAYAGLLSALGVGFLFDAAYLVPLMGTLMLIAMVALAIGARSRRGYGPFFLGLAASAIVFIGKLLFDSNFTLYVGIVLLVGASVWNAWPVWQQQNKTCGACSGG